MEDKKLTKLTPERVKILLQKIGSDVTIEESQLVLEFINKIAHLAVIQYLSKRFK